jgi:hypothetical protein
MSAGKPMAKTIAEFKETRWWEPAVRRYRAHFDACERLECKELIEPFSRFVSEVMTSPEGVRDDMLDMPELAPFETVRRYRQYDAPTRAEQAVGSGRPRDKDRRR